MYWKISSISLRHELCEWYTCKLSYFMTVELLVRNFTSIYHYYSLLNTLRAHGCAQMRLSIGSWGHWWVHHMRAFRYWMKIQLMKSQNIVFLNISFFYLVNYKLFWYKVLIIIYNKCFERYVNSKFPKFWSFKYYTMPTTIISRWIYLQIETKAEYRKVVYIVSVKLLSRCNDWMFHNLLMFSIRTLRGMQ